MILNCFYQKYFDEEYYSYVLIQSAGQKYVNKKVAVITSDWETASKLSFWLPGQPEVLTVACGSENQYAYWKKSELKNVLYLDFKNRSHCVKRYFSNCEPLETFKHSGEFHAWAKMPSRELYAYFCKT